MFLHIFSAIEDNHNWVHHPSCWKTRPFSWKKLSMTTSLRVWKLVASLRNTLKRLAGALIKHYLVTIQFIAEKNSAKNHTWKHTKNQTCSWCNGRSFRFPYQPYQDPDICQKLSSISAQRPRSLLGGSCGPSVSSPSCFDKKVSTKDEPTPEAFVALQSRNQPRCVLRVCHRVSLRKGSYWYTYHRYRHC